MLKVRTTCTFPTRFAVELGQRNAHIVSRRTFPQTDAFAFVGPGYDLIHFVNLIPVFSQTPFIVSFDDWLPYMLPDERLRWLDRLLVWVLSGKKCIALVSMSEFAKKQLTFHHRRSRHLGTLLRKTEVIYPAVPLTPSHPKVMGDSIRLLFVGADFMRHGLPSLTIAHNLMEYHGIPIETTVVSPLRWDRKDYFGPRNRAVMRDQITRLRQSSIRVIDSTSDQVMADLLRNHDFLCLPTFHDPFSYIVLEAMAHGTPVIATNTCALPELIDNGVNGHLLPFPNDMVGRWEWLHRPKDKTYTEAYLQQTIRLGNTLLDKLLEVWQNRHNYQDMSAAALDTITKRFSQDHARSVLEQLYADTVAMPELQPGTP